MEEGEKQKLLFLRKQLEEVRAEIETSLVAIRQEIFDKAKRRGDIIRGLRQKERQIIREIQDILNGKKP